MFEKGLRVGLIGEAITSVTSKEAAITMGSGSVNVYATPAMIALMEAATVSAVDPYLTEGRVSVGMEVNVRHVSPTPIGEQITSIAEVTRIDGKRITLEVRAWDEHELIGIGSIVRYLVDYDAFSKRVESSRT